MECDVLVSTLNQKDCNELIKKMNVNKCTIINQMTNSYIDFQDYSTEKYNVISVYDKGLSKSRNLAIEKSKGDICLFADDDLSYNDEYEKIVIDAYEKYKDADLIAFIVTHDDGKNKKVLKEGKVNFLNSMRIESVQITFKRKSILEKNIKFDENFGSGSKFYCGEENIFLSDCIKNKLKIYYVPLVIAHLEENSKSSWFKGYNEKFFISKGAMFKRMSNIFSIPLILQFAIRKYSEYKKEANLLFAIVNMIKGLKEYQKIK